MKLMFHKTELYGHWFDDDILDEDFTEKIPLNTGYIFDEELNEWVLIPLIEETEQIITENE
jgi:hypothetical protein